MDPDLRQMLYLNCEGRIQDGQLLSVLDQVPHLAILFLELLDLEIALKNLSLGSFLLVLKAGLELVLCIDPLVEITSQIPEVSHLLVDSV